MFRAFLCALLAFVSLPAAAGSRTLTVEPVYSDKPDESWLAVAEMVLRHEGYPALVYGDYQCGIVSGSSESCAVDCNVCRSPQKGTVTDLIDVFRGYATLINQRRGTIQRPLDLAINPGKLSWSNIVGEIREGNPVVVLINPPGKRSNEESHPAVIVGVRQTRSSMKLVINDPYPYITGPQGVFSDPYTKAGGSPRGLGRYIISYEEFTSSFGWSESLTDIERE